MTKKRVVITGMGAVTPLANNAPDTWRALIQGKSGIGPITIFDASNFPTKIAGEVKNLDWSKWLRPGGFSYLGRNSFFALEAAQEAVRDAGIDISKIDVSRYGIYFGAGDTGFDFVEYASILSDSTDRGTGLVNAKNYFSNRTSRANAKEVLEHEPCEVINHLAEEFGTEGVISNCLTACAASSQAIGEAVEIIRRGDADLMISGGAHSMIHPLGVAGFNLLTALSTLNDSPQKASRPFDKHRDGFVLSEGSGVVIVEELEHARKRGAKIYAEIIGYGSTADAFRMTDPHPEGRGAIRAMQLALADAGLSASQIQYISAHGTSTQLNDRIETMAVKKVFGPGAGCVPMSSIKSMLGHMIAAAGAVELIAGVLTIRDSMIPATINYETPDDSCDLDYVPNTPRQVKVDSVLSNSFGFGGQNITLIVKKFEGR